MTDSVMTFNYEGAYFGDGDEPQQNCDCQSSNENESEKKMTQNAMPSINELWDAPASTANGPLHITGDDGIPLETKHLLMRQRANGGQTQNGRTTVERRASMPTPDELWDACK